MRHTAGQVSGVKSFTAAATDTVVYDSGTVSMHSLQVTKTGTVSAWTVLLEGSLDGTSYRTLATHTEATGDGAVVDTVDKGAMKLRLRCSAFTGTGSVLATFASLA